MVNHGVTEERVEAFEAAMMGFFAQDRSVKEQVRRTEQNSKGWYDDELTKQRVDWKEGFDVGAQEGSLDLVGLDGYNQWPAVDGFEATIRRYFATMERCLRNLQPAWRSGWAWNRRTLCRSLRTVTRRTCALTTTRLAQTYPKGLWSHAPTPPCGTPAVVT